MLACLSGSAQAEDHKADDQTSILDGLTIQCIAEIDEVYVAMTTSFGCNGDDWDGDGVCDDYDNCTEVKNPEQEDTDDDYIGNLCDPDFNNDGVVGFTDLGMLMGSLNTAEGQLGYNAVLDINSDGFITKLDMYTVRALIGSAPGPSGLFVEYE